MVLRGFSDPYGFWNTSCTTRRKRARASCVAWTASMPPRRSEPALGGSIIVTRRASVDLPQPDSPTTARVRPAASVNEIPPTACSVAGGASMPRRTV